MNLKQAQQHLLRDAKYRQQYDKQKDGVELAMHIVAIRKELGISHLDLSNELGISRYDISKFENLKGRVAPWVISSIVTRFQGELRKRGINVEKWFVARPHPEESPRKTERNVETIGRPTVNLPLTRQGRGSSLPINRRTEKSPKEKESEV
jgi:transcriptional regulator with XRE-family HTH domain